MIIAVMIKKPPQKNSGLQQAPLKNFFQAPLCICKNCDHNYNNHSSFFFIIVDVRLISYKNKIACSAVHICGQALKILAWKHFGNGRQYFMRCCAINRENTILTLSSQSVKTPNGWWTFKAQVSVPVTDENEETYLSARLDFEVFHTWK